MPDRVTLPKYAIFDDCDAPERKMIVELIGDKYRYMVPTVGWKRRMMTPGTGKYKPTDIKEFGFLTNETAHSVIFTRVAESTATYPDGVPRKWHDRYNGAEIGQSFELPRVRVKARKAS
jgi:hypothetical protein